MYKKREHIHFMGIGGIGMSGIAEILKLRGYTVSGCDLGTGSKTLEHLSAIGCTIYQGHDVGHMHEADVLVYSSAVQQTDVEVQAALHKGIPVIPRALMLGELMRTKYSVAVSGSHGKTTTTSLLSHIMIDAGRMPTVVVGGVLKNIANNAQFGSGEIFIAEADESDRSLLLLSPTMAIVTNIDAEHLDIYRDLDDIKETFKGFLARLPFYGKASVCIDDEQVRAILPLPHVPTLRYGLSDDADLQACNVLLHEMSSTFDVYRNTFKKGDLEQSKELLGTISLSIPGIHNVRNALAAIGIALEFEVSFEAIAHALAHFKGVERRFEFKGTCRGSDIFDDYGHHPTEIRTVLRVAQKRAKNDLHVVFQPHRFSRTEKLWDDFVDVFARSLAEYDIKTLLITDIYPASEAPIAGITAEKLAAAIKVANPALHVQFVADFYQLAQDVRAVLRDGDLVLTLGAGKLNQLADILAADQA
ncbi:UDP-N-acetylmuramate--L-alanine ligase [Candidatus Dependentiae bacterium]|nr:UDP-N-acetylmuramate--L-alanine ligase [Candidatus Dependentiae bacterium]